jgi:hypothetical protein
MPESRCETGSLSRLGRCNFIQGIRQCAVTRREYLSRYRFVMGCAIDVTHGFVCRRKCDHAKWPGNNYTPYGLDAWDRRRTPSGVHPTLTTLNNATDARTVALCTAIKNLGNNGVTLWVVYYGTTDLATTERMKNCATSRDNHFFAATNTTSLITTFNQIADSISELKLTG